MPLGLTSKMLKTSKLSFIPAPSTSAEPVFRPIQATPDAKIRGKLSSSAVNNSQSLLQLFKNALKSKEVLRDAPAVYHQRKVKLTFRSLSEISDRMSKKLSRVMESSNVGPNDDGDIVVGYIGNNDEMDERYVAALFATMKLQVTIMPLKSSIHPNDLNWTLQLVKPVVMITGAGLHPEIQEILENWRTELLSLDELWYYAKLDNQSLDNTAALGDDGLPETVTFGDYAGGQNIIAIYFTAGSVGSPHAVRIGTKEVYNRIYWQYKVFPHTNGDAYAVTASMTDPRSLVQIFTPFLVAKPLTMISWSDQLLPSKLMSRVGEVKLTRLTLLPPVFEMLINHAAQHQDAKQMLSSVTHWTITGGSLSYNLAKSFFMIFSGVYKNGVVLISTYGSVELLGEATYEVFFNLDDLDKKTIVVNGVGVMSAGIPIANTSVTVLDYMDKPLPIGQRGEVVLSGLCLASGGYCGQGTGMLTKFKMNNSVLRAQEKKNYQFRTGDFGKVLMDKNGVLRLYIEGRMDSMVKIDGKIINLSEIRTKIMGTGLVHDAYPFTYQRGRDSQILVAACVLKSGVQAEAVRDTLAAMNMKNYQQFPVIFALEKIPILETGSVDRKQLRILFRNLLLECSDIDWQTLDLPEEGLEGATFLFKAIALSVAVSLFEIIQLAEKSFWDIGGSDLSAVIVVKMCKDNGYMLSIDDFIKAKSLRDLAYRMYCNQEGDIKSSEGSIAAEEKYHYDIMKPEDERDVLSIVKGDGVFNKTKSLDSALKYWQTLITTLRSQRMSIVAKDKMGRVVAVAISGAAGTEMKLPKPPLELSYGLEMLDSCLTASKYEMWRKSSGNVAQIHFIGVKEPILTAGERVALIEELISKTTFIIRQARFSSLVISTANPLIQEVATQLLNFQSILEFPIARYKSKDKLRPFSYADDNHSVAVLIKNVTWDDILGETQRVSQSLSKIRSSLNGSQAGSVTQSVSSMSKMESSVA